MATMYTWAGAATALGVDHWEIARACEALGISMAVEHISEKQVFAVRKWLRRNPPPGLHKMAVARLLEVEYDEVWKAMDEFYGYHHGAYIAERDLLQIRNIVEKRRRAKR